MRAVLVGVAVLAFGPTFASAKPICEAVREQAVGGYARCLLHAEARFTRNDLSEQRDRRRANCRRRFLGTVDGSEGESCSASRSPEELAAATEVAVDNLRALIEGLPDAESYYKAAGAVTCPAIELIRSEAECRTAGAAVGHPFVKVIYADASSHNGAGRPGGCFWDQNGGSYFNVNLTSSATWGGTGGICRSGVAARFEIVSSGTCEDAGFHSILDIGECQYAGAVMSGDPNKGFRYDQPPGGYSSTGADRATGCTFHDANVANPLQFFPQAKGHCGVYNFHCVCRAE